MRKLLIVPVVALAGLVARPGDASTDDAKVQASQDSEDQGVYGMAFDIVSSPNPSVADARRPRRRRDDPQAPRRQDREIQLVRIPAPDPQWAL